MVFVTQTFSVLQGDLHGHWVSQWGTYHLYVIEVSNRKELYDALRVKQIYTQIHYIPLHTMPYYQKLGNQKGYLPIAEAYYEGCISLPMYPTLTNREQDFVIKQVFKYTK